MEIEHLMVRLGQILADDEGLRVLVRGASAYASPGEIVLPSISHFGDLPISDAERVLHGLVDHEAGHAVDTDFDALAEVPEGTVLRFVVNAVEDGVVERRRALHYPGSRYNYAAKNAYFWSKLRGQIEAPTTPFLWRLLSLLVVVLRADGMPDPAEVSAVCEADDALRPALAAALEATGDLDALARAPAKPTAESIARARAILARWGIPEDQRLDDDDRRAPPTPEEEVLGAFTATLATEARPYVVFDPSFDLEVPIPGTAARYAELARESEGAAAELAEVFEAALHARVEARVRPGADLDDERAEVDDAQLAAYALGAEPVDSIWVARTGGADAVGKAAVALLVDCSGSMEGQKARVARQCAVACHEALARVHVPHEICGFTTALSRGLDHPWFSEPLDVHFDRLRQALVAAAARGERVDRYARECSGDPAVSVLQVPTHGIFKDFESFEAFGLAGISGIANNLDGEAVLWQCQRLARRPEPRKILVVISDGLPNGTNRRIDGERHLADAVRRALTSGIEVYAIGIGTDHVRDYYPHWRVCKQLHELPAALASILSESVVGGTP